MDVSHHLNWIIRNNLLLQLTLSNVKIYKYNFGLSKVQLVYLYNVHKVPIELKLKHKL